MRVAHGEHPLGHLAGLCTRDVGVVGGSGGKSVHNLHRTNSSRRCARSSDRFSEAYWRYPEFNHPRFEDPSGVSRMWLKAVID